MNKTRLLYFVAVHESKHSSLSDLFQGFSYDENRMTGFEIIRFDRGSIYLRFVEKVILTESLTHPDGTYEEIERIGYNIFKFSITYVSKGRSLIQIINPPRSLKRFALSISKVLISLSLERVCISPISTYLYFKNNKSVSRVHVRKALASNIVLSEKSLAKVEVVSHGDALEELERRYGGMNMHVDKINFSMAYKNRIIPVEASSSGAVVCEEEVVDEVFRHAMDVVKST